MLVLSGALLVLPLSQVTKRIHVRVPPPLSQVTKVATSRPLPENPYHSKPRPEPNPVIEGQLQPSKHGSKLFFWDW